MTLPEHYDFNERYEPLPVFDQGTERTCWYHQWAVHLAAFRRMYDGASPTYYPHGFSYASDADGCGMVFDTPDGEMHIRNYSGGVNPHYWDDPLTVDAIKGAIYKNGVIGIGVPSMSIAFQNVPHGDFLEPPTKLYVVHADGSSPDAVIDHTALVVGFTPDGVIIQNSWGGKWGWNGRAVLGWDFIFRYGCGFEVDTYEPHSVDGLVLPPIVVPAPNVRFNPYPQPDFTNHPIAFTHLRLSASQSDDVRWVQWALGVPTTGVVDRASQIALLNFKRAHHLPAVAVVDGPTGRGLAKVTR